MTTPDKCPKCGAGSANKWSTGHEFQCNTLTLSGGDVFDVLICVRTKRDQLASQVAELASALHTCLQKLEAVSIHTCPEAIAVLAKHKPIP